MDSAIEPDRHSVRCSGTRRFVICFGSEGQLIRAEIYTARCKLQNVLCECPLTTRPGAGSCDGDQAAGLYGPVAKEKNHQSITCVCKRITIKICGCVQQTWNFFEEAGLPHPSWPRQQLQNRLLDGRARVGHRSRQCGERRAWCCRRYPIGAFGSSAVP